MFFMLYPPAWIRNTRRSTAGAALSELENAIHETNSFDERLTVEWAVQSPFKKTNLGTSGDFLLQVQATATFGTA